MVTAVVCTGLLALLVFALGFATSLTRQRSERAAGFDPDPADPLHKMVRAHGNTIEYAPILGVLMLYLGSQNPAAWVTWVMIAATFGRFLIVPGILTGSLEAPNPMRFIGAVITYLGGLALAVAVLLTVL